MWREWKKRAEVRKLTSFERFICERERTLYLILILSFATFDWDRMSYRMSTSLDHVIDRRNSSKSFHVMRIFFKTYLFSRPKSLCRWLPWPVAIAIRQLTDIRRIINWSIIIIIIIIAAELRTDHGLRIAHNCSTQSLYIVANTNACGNISLSHYRVCGRLFLHIPLIHGTNISLSLSLSLSISSALDILKVAYFGGTFNSSNGANELRSTLKRISLPAMTDRHVT